MKIKAEITKEMTINEVIQKYPEAISTLLDYGMHCLGCPMAAPETIAEAVKAHNIDLEKFLNDLNKTADDFKK